MRSYSAFVLVLAVTGLSLLVPSGPCVGVVWQNLTQEDGLISNRAHSLSESADGSVWIGTFGVGLNQYIEGELLTWDEGTSWLPDDIMGICEDAQGAIWCLSYHEGCGFLESGMWHEGFTLDWDGVPGVQLAQGGIACGPDGRLWAGFAEGIKWYDPQTGEGQKVWTSPRYSHIDFWGAPHFLYVTSAGRIWFCSKELDGQDNLYEMDDTGSILRVFPGLWGTVAEAPDGTIWYGDQHDWSNLGIMRLEGDEFVYAGPPEGYPASVVRGPISISETGELVCNGYDPEAWAVISTFDGESWQPYPCPFKGAISIRGLIIDRHGDIWLANRFAGVWVLHRDESAREISLDIATNESSYSCGDLMAVSIDLVSDGDDGRTVDFYVALQMPSGELLFYPSFGTEMTPFVSGVQIPSGTHLENHELFTITLPDLPEGTYRWHAACTRAGTMDFASNIASCEWQFE